MNYKLINYTADIRAPSALYCDVLEIPTNLVIKQQLRAPKARDLAWKLNHGRGFDGFTPEFFLHGVPPITIEDDS